MYQKYQSPSSLYQLSVLIQNRPAREYFHGGNTFIEGINGLEYTIRIRNNSSNASVGAVVSVDGLSVMTGEPASERDYSMYLIHPGCGVDIPGWRLDNDSVAHFAFGSIPTAYASHMGAPENIGVIGALIYPEKSYRPVYRGTTRGGGGYSFGGLEKGIGTEFGRETEHRVQNVAFDHELTPAARLVLRYDDARGLSRRGIILASSPSQADRVMDADPFPAGNGCRPPEGWRG